jgi:hypothetical protein
MLKLVWFGRFLTSHRWGGSEVPILTKLYRCYKEDSAFFSSLAIAALDMTVTWRPTSLLHSMHIATSGSVSIWRGHVGGYLRVS